MQELGLRPSCDSRSLTGLMGFDRVARTVNRFQSALTCALQLNAGAEPSAFPVVCEPPLGLSQNIFFQEIQSSTSFSLASEAHTPLRNVQPCTQEEKVTPKLKHE